MSSNRSRHRLPGAVLPEGDDWARRHRLLLGLLLAHVPALALFGAVRGLGPWHLAADVLPLAGAGVLAALSGLPRWARESLVAAGLMGASAAVVHLSGGVPEAHFHFFVVLALLPLYQTWPPLLVAVGLVVLHHGIVGTLAPGRVFGEGHVAGSTWPWALLHGTLLLAAAAASGLVIAVGERQRAQLAAERDAARTANEQALRTLAHRDPLTGLANRRLLDERLQGALAGSGAGVLLLDLDHFKTVNDTHGHDRGDAVLLRCARALAEAVRPGDLLARLGGDEFVLVCPGLPDRAALDATATRLSAVVEDAVGADGVGVSIGAAVAVPGEDATTLLARADRAMYDAKRVRAPRPRRPADPATSPSATG